MDFLAFPAVQASRLPACCLFPSIVPVFVFGTFERGLYTVSSIAGRARVYSRARLAFYYSISATVFEKVKRDTAFTTLESVPIVNQRTSQRLFFSSTLSIWCYCLCSVFKVPLFRFYRRCFYHRYFRLLWLHYTSVFPTCQAVFPLFSVFPLCSTFCTNSPAMFCAFCTPCPPCQTPPEIRPPFAPQSPVPPHPPQ